MAEVNTKLGPDLWEMLSFPDGIPKTSWNFYTYVMYAVIKHILRGSFKGEIDAVLQSGCQTSVLLGEANYFQLEESFLSNQEYAEPLRVVSVAEDVVIVQIFRQACEDPPEEENMGVLNADLSLECDFNLCFKNITASEVPCKSSRDTSSKISVQLNVIP